MPQYTDNYGLIKPYETENYDIEVQNSNMDKIDLLIKTAEDKINVLDNKLEEHKEDYAQQRQQDQLKVAKVEKELNNYKATMQQVNINQEPKQKATGYGVISLPPNAAEGQVSSVGIKGLTATNLVKNGDFSNGTTGWRGLDSTIAVVDNKLTATIASLGQSVGLYGDSAINSIKLITGHKYYVSGSIYPKYVTPIRIGIGDLYAIITNPIANAWNRLSTVITATKDETRAMLFYVNATTQYVVGDTIKYKELFAVDLTATFGAGNEPTKEECDQIFANWFDGTKSTVGSARIKSVGKNILPTSISEWEIGTIIDSNGLNGGASNNLRTKGYHKIIGGVDLVGRLNTGYKALNVYFYDVNRQFISVAYGLEAAYKTVPTNAVYYRARFRRNDDAAIGLNELDLAKPQLEKGTVATPYEPYRESNVYITAKNEAGSILELRSLPNGTKDEIDVVGRKVTIRTGKVTFNGNENWTLASGNEERYIFRISDWTIDNNSVVFNKVENRNAALATNGKNRIIVESAWDLTDWDLEGDIGISTSTHLTLIFKANLGIITVQQLKQYLNQYPIQLIYQLAEPIEIPIQVSGSIVSYPSGTIYIERILPDAGVYTDKITVLHQDAPIKAIEKLSKVDFMTGVETELDIDQAEISEDKLSFTHPELSEGDIVFFEYEYDVESTEGEAEVEFYDSRYVVKDTQTDKFYKWNIVVTNGQPSIELVEV